MKSDLNVICLESEAFFALVENVVDRLKEKQNVTYDKWIDDQETMKLLHISSRTTLQNLRDEGKIRYTQPSRKLILYDRDSVLEHLNSNSKNPF